MVQLRNGKTLSGGSIQGTRFRSSRPLNSPQVESEDQDQEGTQHHNVSTTQNTATPQNPVPLEQSSDEEQHAAAGSAANAESKGGGSTSSTSSTSSSDDDDQAWETDDDDDKIAAPLPLRPAAATKTEDYDDDAKDNKIKRASTPPLLPIMPPDRRPTPGRIINAREVNELGAEPIPSRGDPAEWPNVRDEHYSNRSYSHYTSDGQYVEDDDAPPHPPKKIGRRKNPEYVKWEEERPLKDQNYSFHCLFLCYERGPSEQPPTYDSGGYQLDYKKVANWMKPLRWGKRPSYEEEDRMWKERRRIDRRVKEIFFEPGAAPLKDRISPAMKWNWIDRVSKDLGVPFHQVGLEEFEEWDRRGFKKAKKGEYEKLSKEQDERMGHIASGSALRKGGYRTGV